MQGIDAARLILGYIEEGCVEIAAVGDEAAMVAVGLPGDDAGSGIEMSPAVPAISGVRSDGVGAAGEQRPEGIEPFSTGEATPDTNDCDGLSLRAAFRHVAARSLARRRVEALKPDARQVH